MKPSNLNLFYANCLKPLSNKKLVKFDFVGFDVETYGYDNKFFLGGIYYYRGKTEKNPVYIPFYDREEMISFLLSPKFMGKYIVATNLDFDLTKLFLNTKYWNDIKRIERGSQLIYAEYKLKNWEKKGKIKFIDTTNYLFFSVEKLGKIIGVNKLDKPKCWERVYNVKGEIVDYNVHRPKDKEEKIELEEYNKYDCKISADFMYFLQRGFNEAGGKLQITLASTSFDVWRRGFLNNLLIKEEYITKKKDIKEFIFEGYYGGRTEVFEKGNFWSVWYFDVNSLYPSVMKEKFPLPQSIKLIYNPSLEYINYYEGVSRVKVKAPKGLHKPFLPFRQDGKLIFPLGTFEGVFNHNELVYAIKLGYEILEVKEQIIYTKSFYPFKDFVDYFYNKRLEYKAQNNKMELVTKLILNSLYGKFGQKKITITEIKDIDYFEDSYQLEKYMSINNAQLKNGFVIYKKDKKYNGKNSYPILASYVTSKARIKMYPYINNKDVIYTDTDSVISKSNLYENVKTLGGMKLEGFFEKCILIKPKLYYLANSDEEIVKAKGLIRADYEDFTDIINHKSIKKNKLMKLKESIRRKMIPYQKFSVEKKFSLVDTKRIWEENLSKPLVIENEL